MKKTLVYTCCWLLMLLFVYAAMSKLFTLPQFTVTLGESPLIHKGAGTLAYVIPITELVVVLLLFFEPTRKAGFAASFLLLLLFTVYLEYMLVYAPALPCSCGGVIAKMSWMQHVWFNLFFTGLSATGFLLLKHK